MKIYQTNEEMPRPDNFINCPKCGHAKAENRDCIKCEDTGRLRESLQPNAELREPEAGK